MSAGREWLYQHLKSQHVRDDERERWDKILARLAPGLTTHIDSAEKPGDARANPLDREAARVCPDSRTCAVVAQGEYCIPTRVRSCDDSPSGDDFERDTTSDPERMTGTERRLASLAGALIGNKTRLSAAEKRLVARADRVDSRLVAHAHSQILAGHDLLGNEFCALRSAVRRRQHGATYTPTAIVDAMVDWAREQVSNPARVVDPGTGSGRFLIAAARKFPNAELIAVEVDPLATLMLRANAAVHGFSDRLAVHLIDYRSLELPVIDGPTLFIGNPPYVRHHSIGGQWKSWLAATASRFGFAASKLSGLHIHFFFKTRELARAGDYGAFITAAEWLDVNYGSALRRMLVDGLGGTAVHVIDPRVQPFADALTTGAIACFRVGSQRTGITMSSVESLEDLAPLGRGRAIGWYEVSRARKWSVLVREQKQAPSGFIELGELFRVHRGQVTGGNAVWIDNDWSREVPGRFKPFTVTGARELLAAGAELASIKGLHRVIDLPPELDVLDVEERKAVNRFLAWARRQGAHEGYIATHRRAWWSVGLRSPAPILCTYMARRAPAFVLNKVKARHINIAHGLYPREPLAESVLTSVVTYLRRHTSTAGGRTYAGGLVKFEPKELERIHLPRVEEIDGYLAELEPTAQALDHSGLGHRREGGDRRFSQ